jgi:DNA (cytosine-5)-methyltransferase 1
MIDKEKGLTFVDLFAGCGGLSLGAMKAGFEGKFAIEYQKNAFDTLKFNLIDRTKDECLNFGIKRYDWPEELPVTHHDIKQLLKDKKDFLKSLKGKIDLVVGGPPCQGFSNAGKRNENDPRNQLYKSYISFINLVNPKILIIENVAGIASKFSQSSASYKDNIINKLKSKYYVDGQLLSSEIFGVPQKRKRFIILGFSKEHFKNKDFNLKDVFEKIISDAKLFSCNYKLNDREFNISNTNVYQAISDLDGTDLKEKNYVDENAKSKSYKTFSYKKVEGDYQDLMRQGCEDKVQIDSHRIGDHSAITLKKYETLIEISQNNNHRSSFNFTKEELEKANWNSKKQIINVLKPNFPSPTLTTCPFDYIHYKQPRILTVREFARIQSFPDWFEFKGIYATSGSLSFTTPRYTQIGNAVPPLMAESIINSIKKIICEN